MKTCFLVIAAIVFFSVSASAQQIIKLSVKKPDSSKMVKKGKPLKTGSAIKAKNDTIRKAGDTTKSKTNTSTTTKNSGAANTSNTDTTKGSKLSYDCSTINKVNTLSVKKNDDGSYSFSLIDDKDNPIVSFNMLQYNKQLYIDKVTKAINSICNDTSNTDRTRILDTLKSQYSYEAILEASLQVPDIDVIAGTLKIYKQINLFTYKDNNTMIKAFLRVNAQKDTATKKGLNKPVLKDTSKLKSPVDTSKKIAQKSKTSKKDTIKVAGTERPTVVGQMIKPHDQDDDVFLGSVIIYDMQIQFQDGFIENIVAHGKLPGNDTLLKFENAYPIAFSTKKNFDRLLKIPLKEKNLYGGDDVYIFVGDLLKFDPNYRLNTRDYFPDNQVYKSDITDSVSTINLNREKTSQILSVQVFSDLKGASSNSPNGLVQINFGKKLNLLTIREPLGKKTSADVGFLNYFTPEFTLSKIENNQKNLVLSFSGGDPAAPTKPNVYATTLNLLLYQEYQIGGKLNIFLLDLPALKSTVFINTSARYGRTSIQDTSRVFGTTNNTFTPAASNNVLQYGANSFQMIPEIQWAIYPDQRYSFAFTQQFDNYRLLTEQFKQVDDAQRYNAFLATNPGAAHYHFQKWVGTSEIVGSFTPSSTNQIFLRYRYNWDLGNAKNNFNQIQVGITTYLTTSNASSGK